jgi:hypothetical protein
MSLMIPKLDDLELDQVESKAEAKLYRAFRDQLPRAYLVLFQAKWILHRESDQARDGEIDFLVVHPQYGYLCIEVKGGGIRFEATTGKWFSIDGNNAEHRIKDPIKQALHAKYSILHKIKENLKWSKKSPRRIACGHAVFFPDISNAEPIVRAELPQQLVGIEADLKNVAKWVETALSFWSIEDDKAVSLGPTGVDLIKNTFARSFDVKPLLSSRIGRQEKQRLRLTEDQIRLLDALRSQRRVAISGGAGTGKTVLAVEKAKRLATEGFKTLLVCYNRQLADYLCDVCVEIIGLDVMDFHQLCHRHIKIANNQSGRDLIEEAQKTYPGTDLFDVQYPAALSYSLDIIADRYDAIVCDEGQDFGEEYWFPIEMLLANHDKSPLYIFFDDNQNVYTRARSFPIYDTPYVLSHNCRNTDPIHHAAYNFYKGEPVSPSGIIGEDIQFIPAASRSAQATRIHAKIVALITKEKVAPKDIAVLVVDSAEKKQYYEELVKRPLPQSAGWSVEDLQSGGAISLDTVKRFKGLESNIVFLWGLNTLNLDRERELLYVAFSRACSTIFVSATPELCNRLDSGLRRNA